MINDGGVEARRVIPDAAVEAAKVAAYEWGDEGDMPDDSFLRQILEAAVPFIARQAQAQAIEDALIDFVRSSVFLTAAQETMARFLRKRVSDLRVK